MKTIGVFQLEQKTYDTLEFEAEFAPSLGKMPKNIHMTIYGDSGHGKTEYAMRIGKQFCKQKLKVDWISYEQSHGMDLQTACIRNNMIEVADYFQVSDPHADKPEELSYFEDFIAKVCKRGSADIFVIDSSKYCDFTVKDFRFLFKSKRFAKKGFVWISHKEGRYPEGVLAKDIAKLGAVTFLVEKYIAEPVKNRYGGNEKYVIYEERARLLNPKHFLDLDKKRKGDLFNSVENAENNDEEVGVSAHE